MAKRTGEASMIFPFSAQMAAFPNHRAEIRINENFLTHIFDRVNEGEKRDRILLAGYM